MANRRVTIWRYAKTDGTWRYHKPAYGRNNKIKPEDGTYYIRWRNGTKMAWQRCHNAANAEQACRSREAMLTAQAYGIVPAAVTANVVWYAVKRCAGQVGLNNLAPHDLRRTCARLCHCSGGELEQIQFLLGHASVQTTERYIGSKQKLQDAVNDRLGISVAADTA